ncbi:hypothetical protein BKA82DRAFT_995681 [Pisolithus tinctorius]|uniref:Uncharacterized protein n=1 Tax=Pisolithus tinctorius Marx 270 TaxID=870435 RepID=A0A0C3KLK8_PISTI|nr:hypothetical protein BKA82DRAFT_995681 [Pisolithus tinctorius]KIO10492.1 hypothetical protein M404DRAFT_995681 [Pisolithus tinctorius Marx 270]
MCSRCLNPDGDAVIKRPSQQILHRLYDEHYTSMAQVYRVMKLGDTEGRRLSTWVKEVIIKSDFDLEKSYLKHTQKEIRKLEELVCEKICDLDRYEDNWAASVLVKRLLKKRTRLLDCRMELKYTTRPTRTNEKLHCSQSRIDDGLMRPSSTSKKPDSVYSQKKGGGWWSQNTPISHQEHNKLRDFLDEHQKTHLLFALVKAGITGNAEFDSFINMPSAVRKAFLVSALDDTPHEADAIQIAALQYGT